MSRRGSCCRREGTRRTGWAATRKASTSPQGDQGQSRPRTVPGKDGLGPAPESRVRKMEKNTAPVDRDVNTSDGAQHGTGRGSDRALLPSRKVSRSQWPTRACRVCGPGSASRGSGVTRRAVGWDSLACAPWPWAARAVNTVRLQTLAWTLSGSLVTGQPSRSPQDPGLAFRPPGWGSEGQICPRRGGRQALGTCWTRAGRTREDPCSEFTQDREGSKAGKPQRPASLGSAPLTQGLLVLCATHPRQSKERPLYWEQTHGFEAG